MAKTPRKTLAKNRRAGSPVVKLPLNRVFPEGQTAILSNHLVVQSDGPEFHLLFFQTHPPLVLADNPQDARSQLAELKGVDTICLARIVVAAERMPAIIQAMQSSLEKSRTARSAPHREKR